MSTLHQDSNQRNEDAAPPHQRERVRSGVGLWWGVILVSVAGPLWWLSRGLPWQVASSVPGFWFTDIPFETNPVFAGRLPAGMSERLQAIMRWGAYVYLVASMVVITLCAGLAIVAGRRPLARHRTLVPGVVCLGLSVSLGVFWLPFSARVEQGGSPGGGAILPFLVGGLALYAAYALGVFGGSFPRAVADVEFHHWDRAGGLKGRLHRRFFALARRLPWGAFWVRERGACDWYSPVVVKAAFGLAIVCYAAFTALLMAAVSVPIWVVVLLSIGWVVPGLWPLVVGGMAAVIQRCDPDEAVRRRVAWLYYGLIATGLAVALLYFGPRLWFGPAQANEDAVLSLIVMSLAYPVGLAVGLFFLGLALFSPITVDPNQLLSASAIWGILGLIGAAVVIGAEVILLMMLGEFLQGEVLLGPLPFAIAFGVIMVPLRQLLEQRVRHQLNRLMPPSVLAEGARAPMAIVFADACGFTTLSVGDESAALKLAVVLHKEAHKVFARQGGRLVKTIGDAILAEFPSSPQALRATMAFHQAFARAIDQLALPAIPLHSGIHFGPRVKADDGDIFGASVNLTSRLQSVADENEIIVSEPVMQQLDEQARVGMRPLGNIQLRSIPDPVAAYAFDVAVN